MSGVNLSWADVLAEAAEIDSQLEDNLEDMQLQNIGISESEGETSKSKKAKKKKKPKDKAKTEVDIEGTSGRKKSKKSYKDSDEIDLEKELRDLQKVLEKEKTPNKAKVCVDTAKSLLEKTYDEGEKKNKAKDKVCVDTAKSLIEKTYYEGEKKNEAKNKKKRKQSMPPDLDSETEFLSTSKKRKVAKKKHDDVPPASITFETSDDEGLSGENIQSSSNKELKKLLSKLEKLKKKNRDLQKQNDKLTQQLHQKEQKERNFYKIIHSVVSCALNPDEDVNVTDIVKNALQKDESQSIEKSVMQDEDRGQKKIKKRLKDPNAPRRPPNAFLLFAEDNRNKEKEKKPNLRLTEIMKGIAEQWKNLDEISKEPYKRNASKAAEKYRNEFEKYKGSVQYQEHMAKIEFRASIYK